MERKREGGGWRGGGTERGIGRGKEKVERERGRYSVRWDHRDWERGGCVGKEGESDRERERGRGGWEWLEMGRRERGRWAGRKGT